MSGAHRARRPRARGRCEGADLDGLGDGDDLCRPALRPRVPDLVVGPGRLAAGLAPGDPGRGTGGAPLVAGGGRGGGARDVQQAAGARPAPGDRARSGAGRSAPTPAVAVRLGRSGAHPRRGPSEPALPADPRPAADPDGAGPVREQRRRRADQHVGPAAGAARSAAGGDLGGRAAGAVAGPPGAVLRGGVRGGRALHVRLGGAAALPGLHPPPPVRRRASSPWSPIWAGSGVLCSR